MISLPCVQREQGKLLAAQGDELDLFLDQRAVLVVLRKMKALTVARGFESLLIAKLGVSYPAACCVINARMLP